MSDHPKCIDISHWQGFPDFAKAKAAGVIACIMKATEGTGYTDPNRAKNFVNATKAGIRCCTYHWLKPGNNAASQIAYYLKVVNPLPGERMIIDYEEDGCTLDQLKEAVRALKADPRDLKVTVYSGHLLKGQLGDKRDDYLAVNTDLWLAQYTTGTPTWPAATYPNWMLWQHSETGTVDGITGSKVDLDRFAGTDAQLLDWISATPEPISQPLPEPDHEVVIDVAIPEGVSLTLTINGEQVYSG